MIYVLYGQTNYDHSVNILGVFKTKEQAERYREQLDTIPEIARYYVEKCEFFNI